MFRQMTELFDHFLSKYQCGFRKGHSSQQCLIAMTDKRRRCLDKGGSSGALLTDLSKAFDCILHDLLIAKLYVYGVDLKSLKFIYSYLTERKQSVKIDDQFSNWLMQAFGVPQGSILFNIFPLLFNIFLIDLFYFVPGH